MGRATKPVAPPSRLLLALEVRGIFELQAFFAVYPLLRQAPRGGGHPVLVLPGLAASDVSTRPLRMFLEELGDAAHGWKQGQNRGPRPGVEDGIDARIAELSARYRRNVSMVGWSLGGVYAREAARRTPSLVRQVITFGSPFASEPRASNAWQLYEILNGRQSINEVRRSAMKLPPPVPSTAIYSRSNGVVAWPGHPKGVREFPRTFGDGSAVAQQRLESRTGPLAGKSRQSAEEASAEVAPRP